jgi:hypothetical protein
VFAQSHEASFTVFLEDVSSRRSLSSADFGKAAQEAANNPKGIALPPPTEFIHSPSEILDAEAALIEAHREKSSLLWRARLQLRRVSEIARELAVKAWELIPKPEPEVPVVELSDEIDLEPDDEADTARTPTPVPFPVPEGRGRSEWEVKTQVVDMTPRRKSKSSRPGSLVPVSDLIIDDPNS